MRSLNALLNEWNQLKLLKKTSKLGACSARLPPQGEDAERTDFATGKNAMKEQQHNQRYWIAINGPSCAISALRFCQPVVTPTPEQLFGFPTWEEAYEAQQLCLNAPMAEVNKFLKGLRSDIKSGRARYIRPKHPQLPTRGPTMWTDAADVQQPATAKSLFELSRDFFGVILRRKLSDGTSLQ
jgi:hypothetical protein